jgi:hypothetical protein
MPRPELGGPGVGVGTGWISPGSRSAQGGVVCGSGSLGAVGCVEGAESARVGLGSASVASPGANDSRCRSALGVVGGLVGWRWVLVDRSGAVVGASGASSFWRVTLDGTVTVLICLSRRGACCLSDLGCQSNETYRHCTREDQTYGTGKGFGGRSGGGSGGVDRSECRRRRHFWRVQFLACLT